LFLNLGDNIMKKFAMAIATASMLGGVYADSCASSMSGFYAGAQLGLNSVSGKQTIDAGANSLNTDLGKKSFVGGLFAGYGMGVGTCAYVGGELYVNFGNNNVTIEKTNAHNATLKGTYNFGAKVRLGYTVSQQAMIFLGLGLERAKWQVKDVAAAATDKKNKTNIAFAPSVGMDMFINKNMFVRGEFTYVLAPKMKIEGAATGTPVVGAGATYKLNATQQRFTLGLGYKF